MRTLHADLLAAQVVGRFDIPLVNLKLTYSALEENYTKGRILSIEREEQPYSHRITILLDNRDKAFNSKDYKGWTATLSAGATLNSIDRTSPFPPLRVIQHLFSSQPSNLFLQLVCVGIPNLMAEEKAKEAYLPEETDTKTVQQLFSAIAGATLAPYTNCVAIDVVYDSTDTLLTTYQPKDSFRLYRNSSRLAALRRLIDYTKCVWRIEDDGKIHVFQPTTSGVVYDYEYSLTVDSEHPFLFKGFAEKIVIPNRIVVESEDDDDPFYSGVATHTASHDKLPLIQYETTYLTSNSQGNDIAEAILSKYAMAADGGSLFTELWNVGIETHDYIKVTDARMGNSRTGNVGKVIWRWNLVEGTMDMTFWFGGWLSVRQMMSNLEVFPSGIGSAGAYFERLEVKDLIVQNISAENLDMVWIDPEGNVLLAEIGDTMDNLADGVTYARVKSLHLDAGQIKLDEAVFFASDFDPRDKFDLGDDDFDNIPEGTVYKRVLSTQINAGKILLSDQCEFSTGYNPSEKRRVFTAEPTTPYDVGDLWFDADVVKSCTTARASGGYVAGDWTQTTIDAIEDGVSFQRVATAALNASGLVLLDEVITDTYGLVLSTAITAGKIKLSSAGVDESLGYGLVASTDISSGHIVLSTCDGDIDDIDDGSTYGKLRLTDISSGHIELTSNVVVTGEWYNESGVEIDATHGINIYGVNNAFTTRATKTGTIQCYVGSDGKIYAGGGSVILDAIVGIQVRGKLLEFSYSGSYKGYIWASSVNGNLQLQAASGYGVEFQSKFINRDIEPASHEAYDCGYSNKAFYQGYFKWLWSDDGNVWAYQGHDDIAILKGLKTRKNKVGRDCIEATSLPSEMTIENDLGQRYIQMGALQGLGLGIMGKLLERIEALEAQVANM